LQFSASCLPSAGVGWVVSGTDGVRCRVCVGPMMTCTPRQPSLSALISGYAKQGNCIPSNRRGAVPTTRNCDTNSRELWDGIVYRLLEPDASCQLFVTFCSLTKIRAGL